MKAIQEGLLPFFSAHALPCMSSAESMTPSINQNPGQPHQASSSLSHKLESPSSPSSSWSPSLAYKYIGAGGGASIISCRSCVVAQAQLATIMTTEFVRVKKSPFHHQEAESLRKRMELQPELSLAPAWPPGFAAAAPAPVKTTSSSESDGASRKKRKHYAAGAGTGAAWEEQQPASLELQLNDPLPLDWEQCLDLQSGRMYYLNRKTLKRSWVRPREQGVNLDLNISTSAIVDTSAGIGVAAPDEDGELTKRPAGAAVSSASNNNMVAVPCANCHLLVMLCKSSPSCPNCKFVQPLAPATPRHQAAVPPLPPPAHRRLHAAVKPLETLSLLH